MTDEQKYYIIRQAERYNFVLHSTDENFIYFEELEVQGYIRLKQKINPPPVYLEDGTVKCNYTTSLTSAGYTFASKFEELLCCDI